MFTFRFQPPASASNATISRRNRSDPRRPWKSKLERGRLEPGVQGPRNNTGCHACGQWSYLQRKGRTCSRGQQDARFLAPGIIFFVALGSLLHCQSAKRKCCLSAVFFFTPHASPSYFPSFRICNLEPLEGSPLPSFLPLCLFFRFPLPSLPSSRDCISPTWQGGLHQKRPA